MVCEGGYQLNLFAAKRPDNRMETDGKGLFIIRNGQKVAKYEAGKWVPLLSGVVVHNTPDGIRIEMPHRAAAVRGYLLRTICV